MRTARNAAAITKGRRLWLPQYEHSEAHASLKMTNADLHFSRFTVIGLSLCGEILSDTVSMISSKITLCIKSPAGSEELPNPTLVEIVSVLGTEIPGVSI